MTGQFHHYSYYWRFGDTIVDAIRLVAANKQVVIAAKYLGKLKTVTQMISVIFLLLNDFPFSIIHLPIGQISVWIACVISIVKWY